MTSFFHKKVPSQPPLVVSTIKRPPRPAIHHTTPSIYPPNTGLYFTVYNPNGTITPISPQITVSPSNTNAPIKPHRRRSNRKRKSHRRKRQTRNDQTADYEYTIDDIPDEIMINIFRYVDVFDLLRNVSRVCTRFAVLHVQGVHTVKVQGKLRELKEDAFVSVVRKFVRLETLDLCNNGSSEDFQITDKGLLQLAHKFIYSNADYLVASSRDPYTGDYDFNFDYEQHLDSITDEQDSFSYTGTTEDTGVTEDESDLDTQHDYNDEDSSSATATSVQDSDQVLQSDVPKKLTRSTHNYTHIYYVYPPPKSQTLLQAATTRNAVTRTDVQDTRNNVEPCYGLHTLKSINFLGCHFITEKGVMYLTYIAKNLRHLNLKGCTKMNDNALPHLLQFEHLESLDLTGCVHLTDNGMKILKNLKGKLTTLDLTFCHQVTDEGLKHLANLHHLENLNLQCCRHITCTGLQTIVNSCPKLKSLNLTGCDKVTLTGISSSNGLPDLEKLNLMGCKLISDKCISVLLTWTNKLTELVLAFSDHVTDEGVLAVIENCPNIQSLNLKRCVNITDECVKHICSRLAMTLTSLNLTGCRNITNHCMPSLQQLHFLQELHLRRCVAIDDEGLNYLHHCFALESLDLSENPLISDKGLKRLCSILCDPLHLRQQQSKEGYVGDKHRPLYGLRELRIEKCPKMTSECHKLLTVIYGKKVNIITQ
jgi:hypothetical protein